MRLPTVSRCRGALTARHRAGSLRQRRGSSSPYAAAFVVTDSSRRVLMVVGREPHLTTADEMDHRSRASLDRWPRPRSRPELPHTGSRQGMWP